MPANSGFRIAVLQADRVGRDVMAWCIAVLQAAARAADAILPGVMGWPEVGHPHGTEIACRVLAALETVSVRRA